MLSRLFRRRYETALPLVQGPYLDARSVYLIEYDRLPCVGFVGELAIEGVFNLIREQFRNQTNRVLQHHWYDHHEGRAYFNVTLFLLNNDRLIELGEDYCMILHTESQYGWAQSLMVQVAAFRREAPIVEVHRPVIGFARQNDLN